MTRSTRRNAWPFLLTLPLTAIGCQLPAGRDRPSAQAVIPTIAPAADGNARTAAAFQAPNRQTDEVVNALKGVSEARSVVEYNLKNADATAFKASRARVENRGRLSTSLDLTQGSLEKTGRPLDVGIQGQGFFALKLHNSIGNGVGYTRDGNFVVSKNGELVLGIGDDGCKLIPPITIPVNTTDIFIGIDGAISILESGQTAKQRVGQLQLTQFINPAGLQLQGGSIFTETEASGPPTSYTPGQGGTGQLLQGFLEGSNVDKVRESARLRFLEQWRADLLRAAGVGD